MKVRKHKRDCKWLDDAPFSCIACTQCTSTGVIGSNLTVFVCVTRLIPVVILPEITLRTHCYVSNCACIGVLACQSKSVCTHTPTHQKALAYALLHSNRSTIGNVLLDFNRNALAHSILHSNEEKIAHALLDFIQDASIHTSTYQDASAQAFVHSDKSMFWHALFESFVIDMTITIFHNISIKMRPSTHFFITVTRRLHQRVLHCIRLSYVVAWHLCHLCHCTRHS